MLREIKNDNLQDYLDFYRKALKLDDKDYESFKNIITTKLPYTFRVTQSKMNGKILKKFKEDFKQICTEVFDGVFTFYKKKDLVDSIDNELYEKFNRFLINACEMGYVQRQEIVSMLPVELLNITKDNFVYEPCAAPGSKTKQILEKLEGTGLLVSNELNKKRVNVLITEAKKNDTVNFVVTQHNAATNKYSQQFDKICCDVPCSGDGTIRKNVNVRSNWNLKQSCSQVKLQIQILKNTLGMLGYDKTNLCVYSTCSLNPAEDEYVINEILKTNQFELVREESVTNNLFNLKFRDGITKFDVIEEYSYENEELSKCFRFYPQDNNTGGFFAAVLRRKSIKDGINTETTIEPKLKKNFFLFDENKDETDTQLVIKNDYKYIVAGRTMNTVHAVNKHVFDFLHTNKSVKILVGGMKAYDKVRCINNDGYYYKISFNYVNKCARKDIEVNMPIVEISEDVFKDLVENTHILKKDVTNKEMAKTLNSLKVGWCVCVWNNTKYFGFNSENKVLFFINKFNREVLAQIVQ